MNEEMNENVTPETQPEAVETEVKTEEVKTPAEETPAEETPVKEEKAPAEEAPAEEKKELSFDERNKNDLHGENLSDRAKALSPGMTVLKRFFRSKLSVIGLVTLVALFLFSFVGPLFSPWKESGEKGTDWDVSSQIDGSTYTYYTDEDGNIVDDNTPGAIEWTASEAIYRDTDCNKLDGMSKKHWFGTDNSGYDSFTRLMYGGRISLTLGFVVVILETLIGVVLGGLAGYYGKWVDNLIMRIVDVLSCIPQLPIMLILAAVFDEAGLSSSNLKLYYMMGILCLLGWSGTARLVRGQILSLREQEFMIAAKCSGLSTSRKIFKHLLPNVVPQLIVSMTMGLGSIILMEATLGYLGIGAAPETATWGNLINLASDQEYRNFYPNLWLPSGVCITLAILAFNFVGDGLRDAFDPKMKR